jgi:glutamyl-tRNA reductase
VPRLTSLSFAHPAVPAEQRAQIAHSVVTDADSQPVFILMTCLRIEMAWFGQAEKAASVSGISADSRHRLDEEAFQHLCRVAAGLESPLIGEPEVLGQFRNALALYRRSSAQDASLVRTLDAAVGVARRARRLLGNGPRGSLAAVAAGMAQPYQRVAILGSGAMARATLAGLDEKFVAVFARRSVQVGSRQALPWDEAEAALRSFPAVISTYPGKVPMTQGFRSALRERKMPLLLIDLGMPPAFAPGGDLVRYVGIDELAAAADGRPSPTVDETLKEDARKAWRRLETPARTSEVIAAMTAVADRAADEEVVRFAQRLRSAADPEPVLRQLAHTVARRVLHSPISYLGSTDLDAVEVLAEAFGVDHD